ncbi:MAG: N-acetylmuramoyl-L-alanine amidase-like domain-containing protein [Nitrospirota bacterium]|nr:N-acetylmuramoyl-L-alanine amidase-like domain-containing protein [Nitrospirota bacterium]
MKTVLVIIILLTSLTSIHTTAAAGEDERILLGRWTQDELGRIISEASEIRDVGKRIDFLSGRFLGVKYQASTLIGDMNTPEVFVIDLQGVDCFTYLDYIEAMRLSRSFSEFKENLKRVRYRSGKVAFENRNHFFTDWSVFNSAYVDDITGKIGGLRTKSIRKVLNLRKDGTYFLPGITPREREIQYIPSDAIDETVIKRLRTGDYVGIYTKIQGLDVTHTGIIIKKQGRVYLRHASSAKTKRKVIEQDLIAYISKTPGLIVLRPKE